MMGWRKKGQFTKSDVISCDDIMQKMHLSYTRFLNEALGSPELADIINNFSKAIYNGIFEARVCDEPQEATGGLLSALEELVGPGDSDNQAGLCLLRFDLNIAQQAELIKVVVGSEAAALSQGSTHWAVVVGADSATGKVTMADPLAKLTTRLWSVDVDTLISALVNEGSHGMISVQMKY